MSLNGKLVLSGLAGFVATLPMTAAMSRLHARLPRRERYPLPPREIAENLPKFGMPTSVATLAYHFLYGAAAGSLYAALCNRRDPMTGALFGVGVWGASYLGWIPAARILTFGKRHPARRNSLMLVSHIVWGATLAMSLRELEAARGSVFSLAEASRPNLLDRADRQG
ncbi:hypothetical protein [Phreatobacter sp.]|uniref:hypothetical protein n=1 Tax=Phreatobacter sp. TaxID=1966341 RepID=UPI0025E10B27|nr:hypothetical protein [Phreatobacter sp.]